MTEAQKKEDGVSLHAGADEHSLMLHLQPNLVAPEFRQATSITGSTYAESVAAAGQKDWPGYIGAPRLGTPHSDAVSGCRFPPPRSRRRSRFSRARIPRRSRYLPFMVKNPSYQEWIASATERDRTLGERQQAWSARRKAEGKE